MVYGVWCMVYGKWFDSNYTLYTIHHILKTIHNFPLFLKSIKSICLREAGNFKLVDTDMRREGSRIINDLGDVFCVKGFVSLINFFCFRFILL